MLRNSILRSSSRAALMLRPAQVRAAHAISNPTLADIEKRWDAMPPQEQADLWMTLRDRMKVNNWAEMTHQEKKAAYYIAFGAHGPRAQDPPGEGWKVALYTCAGLAVSFVLFVTIRSFGGNPPSTMNREWEEASNEYLKKEKSEPITGLSSEGYSGTGQIQSAPKKK